MDLPHPWLRGAWFLTGPTASGKTRLALQAAQRFGLEIVSLDSMALYRGLDIGVAKPTPAERAQAPHHLLDLVDPHEEFSVAQYLAAAERAVGEIHDRGRRALFVGGTPLYLKALFRGLFAGPAADWRLRHELAELAEQHGPAALHQRLAEVDAAAAARLHPNDTRRLIRALEVFYKTGQPLSQQQTHFDAPPRNDVRVWSLTWPRETLHARIEARVARMFADGWIDEVRRLLAGPPLSRTALQAVGYAEIIAHLRGERDLAATQALIVQRTRQFAKRQETWFRSLPECRFVPGDDESLLDHMAAAESGRER